MSTIHNLNYDEFCKKSKELGCHVLWVEVSPDLPEGMRHIYAVTKNKERIIGCFGQETEKGTIFNAPTRWEIRGRKFDKEPI